MRDMILCREDLRKLSKTRGSLARQWRAVTSAVKAVSETTMGKKGRKMRGKQEKGTRVEVGILLKRERYWSSGKTSKALAGVIKANVRKQV